MEREKVTREDIAFDKSVKIQGTEFDRKRVLTDKQITYAKKLLSKGYAITHVAKLLGTSYTVVRYATDEEYRNLCISRVSGNHTGTTHCTVKDRIDYKKQLVALGKVTV